MDGSVIGDDAARKRGRKQQRPDPQESPVAEFAWRLCELKAAAGDPSYDRMRGEFGAVASKSALSAAARGKDLPSWETAWEFVRCLAVGVLGQDEEAVRREWLLHWESARTAKQPEPPEQVEPESVEPDPVEPVRRRWLKWLVAGAAAVAVVAGAVWFWWPEARPIPGDASLMLSETVPDGTEFPVRETFVKTWEVRNVGREPWDGRYLAQVFREGDAACTAPQRVSVGAVPPGETAALAVPVFTGDRPGRCKIAWKMVDEDGRQYFPEDLRPVFFDIQIGS
ncbi:NBR1-Ig-like domain-containing protein [Saccharopolyspora mangrovi]|uniref:NBR1-Ig-like domain-containing protein n=1 Tax=Saccharopolyspora mangrovi TaxID=3082379 RepID=A0ABU6A3K2_9PSEU|nr:NBR1-Ig-like domain-containing protein [Saccharopolyspora sp. S2-29]MEB3366157.1 NBR1-Ig-like domain-containing protein [Saccharopolyspora sp. S2-29]